MMFATNDSPVIHPYPNVHPAVVYYPANQLHHATLWPWYVGIALIGGIVLFWVGKNSKSIMLSLTILMAMVSLGWMVSLRSPDNTTMHHFSDNEYDKANGDFEYVKPDKGYHAYYLNADDALTQAQKAKTGTAGVLTIPVDEALKSHEPICDKSCDKSVDSDVKSGKSATLVNELLASQYHLNVINSKSPITVLSDTSNLTKVLSSGTSYLDKNHHVTNCGVVFDYISRNVLGQIASEKIKSVYCQSATGIQLVQPS